MASVKREWRFPKSAKTHGNAARRGLVTVIVYPYGGCHSTLVVFWVALLVHRYGASTRGEPLGVGDELASFSALAWRAGKV